MTKPVRSLLEAGRVFAAHEVKGHSCQARISLEDGCLYLHSLRDRPLPLGAAIVQVGQGLLSWQYYSTERNHRFWLGSVLSQGD